MIGSRFGIDTSRVDSFLRELRATYPEIVVVSGGAEGVDNAAEQSWRSLGGEVVSFRPTARDAQSFTIMRVEMGATNAMYDLYYSGHPTWAEYAGACFYRDMLIADEAERCVAFWNGRSKGTANTMDLFRGRGKPVHQMT